MNSTEKVVVAELTEEEHEMLKQILLCTKGANQCKLDELMFADVHRLYEIYKESEDDGSFKSFEDFSKAHSEMTDALRKGVDRITNICTKILK